MTTAKSPKSLPTHRLPDTPFVPDEKMTVFDHLTITGSAHFLAQYLGNLDTTVMGGDRYLTTVLPAELADMTGVPYPDMLVSFNAYPDVFRARNGYVISEQGEAARFRAGSGLGVNRAQGRRGQANHLRGPGHS